MDKQVKRNFWDFCTLNPDAPPRKPVIGFNINLNLPSTIFNVYLKIDPGSTPTLGTLAAMRSSELTSSDGAVAVRSKVPKPLPPGMSWERMTSEKKTELFFQFSSTTAGSSPCDEKGASVQVRM